MVVRQVVLGLGFVCFCIGSAGFLRQGLCLNSRFSLVYQV